MLSLGWIWGGHSFAWPQSHKITRHVWLPPVAGQDELLRLLQWKWQICSFNYPDKWFQETVLLVGDCAKPSLLPCAIPACRHRFRDEEFLEDKPQTSRVGFKLNKFKFYILKTISKETSAYHEKSRIIPVRFCRRSLRAVTLKRAVEDL